MPATNRGAAGVAVRAGERQHTVVLLGHGARARDAVGKRTVGRLVEYERGVIGNLALQAICVTNQRSLGDAPVLCLRARQGPGGGAGLLAEQTKATILLS